MLKLPRLAEIDAWIVDGTIKGYPGQAAPRPLGTLGEAGWNVLGGDLPMPVAVLKASALEHNRRWMQRFLAMTGASLAPHGKTTMSPQLFQAQLEDGAFGITCATVAQLQVYRRHGIRRVFMANQVIGAQGVDYVVRELARDPDFELYLTVDSVEGIEQLARAATRVGLERPVRVLVEVGTPGGRTGVRALEDVRPLLAAIDAAVPRLALHGIEAYEEVVPGDPAHAEPAIRALLALQREADALGRASRAGAGRVPWILSAGGSVYFDLVAEGLRQPHGSATTVLLRSGCYLSHDHVRYTRAEAVRNLRSPRLASLGEGLRPALEVWATVQSRPEATRAYANAGKRDLSHDLDLPVATGWYRPGSGGGVEPLGADHRIFKLNDQHAHLDIPATSPLAVGDLVRIGISHPCTTFDRWQLVYVVDDDYAIQDAIRTFF